MKYHITATIVNALIIYGVLIITYETFELFDNLYFVKKGAHLERFFAYQLFFFSWAATLIIYVVKTYKRHFYLFMIVNLLFSILICSYKYTRFTNESAYVFSLKTLFSSIWDAIIETIAPVLVISILVHISQNLIGKKFLPEKYKPLN